MVDCSHVPGPKLRTKQTSTSVTSSRPSQNLEPSFEISEETSRMLPEIASWPSLSAVSTSSMLLALWDFPYRKRIFILASLTNIDG